MLEVACDGSEAQFELRRVGSPAKVLWKHQGDDAGG